MLRDLGHMYVEAHVRVWDALGFDEKVRVPRWYARLWRYPDSAWRNDNKADRHRWKTWGYHIGHVTAYLLPLLLLAAFAGGFLSGALL